MVALGDLAGSGGAERAFSDVFEHLHRGRDVRPQLITSANSVRHLQAAGKLAQTRDVVVLPLGSRSAQSKFGLAWLTCSLLLATLNRGFDIVHICLPTPSYLPYAAIVSRLPRRLRPAITMSIIDCTVAPNLSGGVPADLYEQQVLDAHRWYARWTRLDGLFSWYEAFAAAAASNGLFGHSHIVSARYCFTNTTRFQAAAKEQLIVWAGRLSSQKRPMLFVEAVAELCRKYPVLVEGWRFEMYGAGVLEPDIQERIRALGLGDRLQLSKAPDLASVFARSRAFVSTQAYENFTSLAMLEAMAAENLVLAEDVGQTRLFVTEGNGILVAGATPRAFAEAMAHFLRGRDRHAAMGMASRAMATDVHTVDNFTADITAFWRCIAASV